MKRFAKIVTAIFAKRSILNVWQGSEYASGISWILENFGNFAVMSVSHSLQQVSIGDLRKIISDALRNYLYLKSSKILPPMNPQKFWKTKGFTKFPKLFNLRQSFWVFKVTHTDTTPSKKIQIYTNCTADFHTRGTGN